MSLSGKVALITGASRGIGRGIAQALAAQGMIAVGTATTEVGAQNISMYLQDHLLDGFGVCMDARDSQQVANAFEKITEKVAAPSVLVNNAGITADNLLLRMKPEEWNAVIDTDLTSLFHVTKTCLKPMMKARWGRIINISSVVGVSGNPGQTNYCAAKAGMLGFTKSLAQEMASRQITVNAIAPGFIDTEMTRILNDKQKESLYQNIPLGRLGQVEDIANAVIFLASDKSAYITGQTLHVNGGMFMV